MSSPLRNELLKPKPLYVTSKKPERKVQVKVRAPCTTFVFLLHCDCSHLFFSLGWFVSCQFYLFPKSFSPWTYCQKALNVLFHSGTVRDTNQKKEFLACLFSYIFLSTYSDCFQAYTFQDCFLRRPLTSAVPQLGAWYFCLREEVWKSGHRPTLRQRIQ